MSQHYGLKWPTASEPLKNKKKKQRMKTSSCKAKGRRLQQLAAERIRAVFGLPESDVKSLPMGSQGADVWLSAEAQSKFPFGIECKAQESLNIWAAFAQAQAHCLNGRGIEEVAPLVVFTRNRSEVLCCLRFEDLLVLCAKSNQHG